MNSTVRQLRNFFVSLKLTVVLLSLSILLIFAATLAQTDLGIWEVQKEFFRSFIAVWHVGPLYVPLPGGYLLGGLLLINLVAAHVYRFKLTWRKTGIFLTHLGLILLLVGELLAGLWQQEYQMRIEEGQTKNYSESYRQNELVLIDVTDAKSDEVIAINEVALERGETIQHPKLPFRVAPKIYYPNSALQMRRDVPNAPPSPATTGAFAQQVVATPLAITSKQNERNVPTAFVELIGSDGSLGTWLVSPLLPMPQRFDYGGRSWKIALRAQRSYKPFSLTLLKFSHDIYPGTDIPKNFSSRVHLTTPDGHDDREVLIYMNNPLRYAGLTFYQASFEEGNDKVTILQVVRNPSWVLPYVSCALVAVGLVVQFLIHLVGFFGQRRESTRTAAPVPSAFFRRRFVPLLFLLVGLGMAAKALLPPRNTGAYDLVGFSRLPVLANGRVKPFDTVARSSLLQLQARQTVYLPDGRELTPREWLMDVCFRPELADTYPTFVIDNLELLSLLGREPASLKIKFDSVAKKVLATLDFIPKTQRRFPFTEIEPHLAEIDRQAKLAQSVEGNRTPFQRSAIELRDKILLYHRLKHTLAPSDGGDFLSELMNFQKVVPAGVVAIRAKQAKEPHDEETAKAMIELGQRYLFLSEATNILAVPPGPGDKPDDWKNVGQALLETFRTEEVDVAALTYAGFARSWRQNQPEPFNGLVTRYHDALQKRFAPQLAKCWAEVRFNSAEPFYLSLQLYVFAFFVAIGSWLKWPEALGRGAFYLVVLAWIGTTAGILTRMWLEGRPPVTNLYSSALFIGWGAVGLCIVLELIYKNAIGSVAAGAIGFGTLIIAQHLALSGDTLEMMRAVLDSNFWLATHVVVVTTGYATTFLAGALAIIYIALGILTPWLNRTPISKQVAVASLGGVAAGTAKAAGETNARMLERMVYGIVCFATLFSFVGTVLGGIWADQSWGRFWGWDPKENGALIIVIWNALILHVRWGGLLKPRGVMCLAVLGNVVTSWSWFGTNMLGIGLHSYGFTEAAFVWLVAFVLSQVAIVLFANLPLENWRSFRAPLSPKPEAVLAGK